MALKATWLEPALEAIGRWLDFQLEQYQQPGCVIAVGYRQRLAFEAAFGTADLSRGTRLTPRHRFRVASHTKSFTAAAVMKLAERRQLRLGDPAGRYVAGLHPALARATLSQLLSHSAGVVRDGADSGQFVDRRPFLGEEELRAELAVSPVLRRGRRFKYSNHGYGLLGLVIEAVAGESWHSFVQREVIAAAGLVETVADGPPPKGTALAAGHSARLPAGTRMVIAGDYPTRAIAPAAGVVSTAADLVRFFGQLAPEARTRLLSRASRRAMIRARWPDPDSSIARAYGLGIISGNLAGWNWFGHSGGLQGYITRTCVFPRQELAVSVLTNAIDGLAHFWLDGAVHILRGHAEHGAPARRLADWSGRWWTLWGAIELLPMRDKVLVATPALFNPLLDASRIRVDARDRGRIVRAAGYASHGEPASLVRNARGNVVEVRLGGTRYRRAAAVANEMKARYRKAGA